MSNPKWLDIALGEKGQKETKGQEDNGRIVSYHACTTLKATDDETPWCSSFINFCMIQAGQKATKSAAARSWTTWGVNIDTPRLGCVVVLKRGTYPAAHVTLFLEDLGDKIKCLGGNQGDCVKESIYPKADVLCYRWPEEVA